MGTPAGRGAYEKEGMVVAIPSRGRVGKQITLSNLKGCPFPIRLYVPQNEFHQHIVSAEVVAVPDEHVGIAATRKFIMGDHPYKKILMLDDDLTFARRRKDDPTKFTPCSEEDISEMLTYVSMLLDDYGHVSISMREGANRRTENVLHCTRVARAIGFNMRAFLHSGADFTNSTVMDDFEVTLHMLTHGWKSAVLNTFVQNQPGSNTAGGASLYRTMEMHAAAARLLEHRYPGVVKTVEKSTKTSWGGGTRTDVHVQWKEAYARGIRLFGAQSL
jgi:hypothetical protein